MVEDLRLQVKFYLQVPPARKMHVFLPLQHGSLTLRMYQNQPAPQIKALFQYLHYFKQLLPLLLLLLHCYPFDCNSFALISHNNM